MILYMHNNMNDTIKRKKDLFIIYKFNRCMTMIIFKHKMKKRYRTLQTWKFRTRLLQYYCTTGLLKGNAHHWIKISRIFFHFYSMESYVMASNDDDTDAMTIERRRNIRNVKIKISISSLLLGSIDSLNSTKQLFHYAFTTFEIKRVTVVLTDYQCTKSTCCILALLLSLALCKSLVVIASSIQGKIQIVI